MIFPPIYDVVSPQAALQAVLGDPVRLYEFGRKQQAPPVVYPYAVWQLISGTPENYLGDAPDIDSFSIQIDVYSKTGADEARAAAAALRAAIQGFAHVTGYNGESIDPVTGNYRVSFDVDWFTPR